MVVARKASWAAVVARVAALDKAKVRVGVLTSAAHVESDMTIAGIAAVHEFGTETVPERSFIRSTFYARVNELRHLQAKLARAVVEGKMTAERALGLLGAWSAAQVKNQITQHDIPPPLKPETIAAKGSSKPLVDTGQLLNAISWALDSDGDGVEP